MTDTRAIAAHAIDTRFADLPVDTRQRAAIYVLDSLGVGIAGSSVEAREELLRVASGWGAPSATVWGRRERLAAPAAAFVNAWQMHNQEFDCLHECAVVHAMAERAAGCFGCRRNARRRQRGGTDRGSGGRRGYRCGPWACRTSRFPLLPPGHRRRVWRRRRCRTSARPRFAKRWRLPSPGNSRRSAATMQAHAEGSPLCCRFRLRSTLALPCNPASWQALDFAPPGPSSKAVWLPGPVRGGLRSGLGPRQPRPHLAHWRIQPQTLPRRTRGAWWHRRRHGAAGGTWLRAQTMSIASRCSLRR